MTGERYGSRRIQWGQSAKGCAAHGLLLTLIGRHFQQQLVRRRFRAGSQHPHARAPHGPRFVFECGACDSQSCARLRAICESQCGCASRLGLRIPARSLRQSAPVFAVRVLGQCFRRGHAYQWMRLMQGFT
jgi:hypothetical protein